MSTESLNSISLNNLFKLLTKNNNELFGMERNKEDKLAIREKQIEIELIQRVLIAKRIEFQQDIYKKKHLQKH